MAEFDFPNNSNDLTGHVALVTGATSGLGWQFARVLANAGAKVAATGRREAKLRELESVIASEGGQCVGFTMDVTDAENIINVVGQAEKALGTVTILINNAGIAETEPSIKISLAQIDQLIATNLRGPFVLACEVARRLIEKKMPGRIVNISSIAATHYSGDSTALYSVSKAAINRLSETLAVEWSKLNINVNAIAPGTFKTEMTDAMTEGMGDVGRYFKRKRIGLPSQLDSTLLYLCSPASECVTGAVIIVDDGQCPR